MKETSVVIGFLYQYLSVALPKSKNLKRKESEKEVLDQVMGRSPCCEKAHTNKGAWTKEEDQRLINYIRSHGEGCWRSLPTAAGTTLSSPLLRFGLILSFEYQMIYSLSSVSNPFYINNFFYVNIYKYRYNYICILDFILFTRLYV